MKAVLYFFRGLPTIVPGPRSPAKKLLPHISITERRISGELLPRAIRVKFATVSFQLENTRYRTVH